MAIIPSPDHQPEPEQPDPSSDGLSMSGSADTTEPLLTAGNSHNLTPDMGEHSLVESNPKKWGLGKKIGAGATGILALGGAYLLGNKGSNENQVSNPSQTLDSQPINAEEFTPDLAGDPATNTVQITPEVRAQNDLVDVITDNNSTLHGIILLDSEHRLNEDISNPEAIINDIIFYMNESYSNGENGSDYINDWRTYKNTDEFQEQTHIAGSYDGNFSMSGSLYRSYVSNGQLIVVGDVDIEANFIGEAPGSRNYSGYFAWELKRGQPSYEIDSGANYKQDEFWVTTDMYPVTQNEVDAITN